MKAYGYGPAMGMPDLSPFCCKLHAYFALRGLPVTWEVGVAPRAPRGKLPYIEDDDGTLLSDSQVIIEALEARADDPLDVHLSTPQRAQARVMRAALEDQLYFGVLYWRWLDASCWARYRVELASAISAGGVPGFLAPWIVRWVRRGVRRSLWAQGTGRMTREELVASATGLLDAIEALRHEGDWFFGDKPSTLDATMYGVLGAAWLPDLEHPVRAAIRARPGLVSYIERLHVHVSV